MNDRFEPSDEVASSLSLHEYGDILRRRRAIILQTSVLVLVVGVVITLMSAPIYQASARILVEAPSYNLNTIDTGNPLSALLAVGQQHSIETQVQLLQGEDLQKSVARKVGGSLPAMTITPVKETEIIEVGAEGSNPQLTADACNVLLQTYIDDIANVNNKGIRDALTFTEEGAKQAQKDLEATEKALRNFKQTHKVAELEKNRDAEQATADRLTAEYQANQTQLASVRAQIAALQAQQIKEPKTNETIVSADADSQVQATEALIANLEVERAALSKKVRTSDDTTPTDSNLDVYFPNRVRNPINPEEAVLSARIAELQKRLTEQRRTAAARNAKINPNLADLQSRIATLDVQASGLAATAATTAQRQAEAIARLNSFPAWEQELNKLNRQLELAKSKYNTFSGQLADLRLRDQTKKTNARIIAYAQKPKAPVRPKKLQNIISAGLLGIFLGLCLALLQEYLDDRINSPDEVDRLLRLPNLGHVPAIEEEGLRLIRDLKAFSPITESYRGLRTNINFAAIDNPVRTLAVTSSGPGEGKSTTVANLAMAMAMDGKRVIVVDADLRRPTAHKLFDIAASPGLTDLLIGTHSLTEVIRPTATDGVNVIPAGSVPPNPAELLGSEAMAHFVDSVRAMADLVIFDSPPALAVADAVVLSARVDGTLFVVAHGETKKTNARQAMDLLARARAHVLGTVLNKMDAPSRGYYYGKYYYYTPLGDVSATRPAIGNPNGANGTNGIAHGLPTASETSGPPDSDPNRMRRMTRVGNSIIESDEEGVNS